MTCTFSEKTFQPAITPFNRWDMGWGGLPSYVTSARSHQLNFRFIGLQVQEPAASFSRKCPSVLS